jgi:DNA-directed RNA polymerase specialized sigma24 family protein
MRKYITQATVRGSIERLEEAARTVDDFTELVELFDRLDARVQAAYEKTVWSTDNKHFNWNAYSANVTDLYGDALQIIYACICQMHNLVDDDDLSLLIEKATYKQKEVFFLRYIRGCSPQRIAFCLEMTDRNVRDMIGKMLTKIQNGMFDCLTGRRDNNIPLTNMETDFLNIYRPKQKKGRVKK